MMDTKQAKDFLVQQTAEQAAAENVSLSDLEKRMMYFTESDPVSCEKPIDLNDEFEQQYEMDEYEAKMSRLLHSAHKRLTNENPDKLRNWNEAVHTLRKGDHYILVLLSVDPEPVRGAPRILIAIAWGLGIGIALVILMVLGIILNHHWNNS